ncbi:MAG TPA: gluconokinase [Acidobacteriaceae bacterium]|nr:gluconokinase [Acidobacteriaceae bacterium]
MILVLMGVTGSGKTTIGQLLAAETGWRYADADDFHSEANKAKMHAGIPLTDQDREPWLQSLHQLLLGWYEAGISGILGCSALKKSYRDELTPQIPAVNIRFILLDVPRPVLEERLRERKNHYMNPDLLQSQLDALEITPDLMQVCADGPPQKIVQDILDEILTVEGKTEV